MIDTDKYQNMRQLLLDFIADPMDEEDEAAWKRHLNTYDELLAEVERLRKDRDLLWDAIRLSGTGAYREEEIAFWHEKLLNMNEAELKEAFKEHYEDD